MCIRDRFDSNLFNKLFNLDVAPYVDSIQTKKANLKYLSWATAYQLLMHYDPKADVKVETDADGFPLFSRGNLHFVKTSITAFGLERKCWLPVMDYKHDAVTNPNARQINDATMRCLAKNVAPVSYTHLDVYKRQIQGQRFQRALVFRRVELHYKFEQI